jgi:biopolymer transport protein ExbB
MRFAKAANSRFRNLAFPIMKATHRSLLTTTFALAFTLFSALSGFAQGDAAPAASPAADAAPQSAIDIILHGGPLIIMIWIAIVGTSIVMVTFIIQNIIQLRNDKLAPPPLIESLRNAISAGNYQEAWEICNANDNYLGNVLKTGLERLGRGKEAVHDGVAEHGLREAQILRTRNSYLSVIGVVSPMIGLLGTVIGMMGAFATLGATGISDPRGLATSIGEVLMATASGLFIAIPAFIAYYVFRNRAQMVIVHADDQVNNLLADIPFEELQGVHIGENFSAGAGAPATGAAQSRKVSMALTTNCPVCNGAITPGQNPCPHCGSTLDWAQ